MVVLQPQWAAASLLVRREIIDGVSSLVYLVFFSDGSPDSIVIIPVRRKYCSLSYTGFDSELRVTIYKKKSGN